MFKRYKGIMLLEAILTVSIFAVVVLATSVLVAASFESKRQIFDLEEKRSGAVGVLMDTAKFLSTATIPSGTNSSNFGGSPNLVVYNYSTNECVQYTFTNGASSQYRLVEVRKVMSTGEYYKDCDETYLSSGTTTRDVIDTDVTGRFVFRILDKTSTPRSDRKSAMVTLFAQVYSDDPTATGARFFPIQTTVSLRDYLVD